MFSFFHKKPRFTVKLKEYESDKIICGLWTEVHKKSIQKDILAVQQKFQQEHSKIVQLSNPSGTMVISQCADSDGTFSYFIGDLVDSKEQDESMFVELLPCGTYAHVTVDFKDPSELTLAVAKAKKYFFERWLPSTNYRVKENVESIELYDRRSNIKLASMELIFPLEEN